LVVRAKGSSRVEHQGHCQPLATVAQQLRHGGALTFCREVEWHGQKARQYVGETTVVVRRPTRRKRKRGGKVRWETEAGLAVAKRLLVASMACVLIWLLNCKQERVLASCFFRPANRRPTSGSAERRSQRASVSYRFVIPMIDLLTCACSLACQRKRS
jgi:hypothetical protein